MTSDPPQGQDSFHSCVRRSFDAGLPRAACQPRSRVRALRARPRPQAKSRVSPTLAAVARTAPRHSYGTAQFVPHAYHQRDRSDRTRRKSRSRQPALAKGGFTVSSFWGPGRAMSTVHRPHLRSIALRMQAGVNGLHSPQPQQPYCGCGASDCRSGVVTYGMKPCARFAA